MGVVEVYVMVLLKRVLYIFQNVFLYFVNICFHIFLFNKLNLKN